MSENIPSPDKRPDLYDDFDGLDRPKGWVNPVKLSPAMQKMLDEKEADDGEQKGSAKSGADESGDL